MKSQTQIDGTDSTLQFRKLQNAQIDCQTQKIHAQIRLQNLMSMLAGRQYQKIEFGIGTLPLSKGAMKWL